MVTAVSGGLVGVKLAEEMLAQINGLAVTATAFVGEHAGVGVAADFDAGHAAAEGVLVGTRGIVGIDTEHIYQSC